MTAVLVSYWLSNICNIAIWLTGTHGHFPSGNRRVCSSVSLPREPWRWKVTCWVPFLFLLPREGRDVAIKTECVWDWPEARCIDASLSPLAPRPVLTNALLGGFVQLEWLQCLAEIYSALRETGLSEAAGCGFRTVFVSHSSLIRYPGLFKGKITNACSQMTPWAVEIWSLLHHRWNKKIPFKG